MVVTAAIERSGGKCQRCNTPNCTSTLKTGKVRLIYGLDDREMVVFAKLMADVVSAGIDPVAPKGSYGYGHFED